MHGIVVHVVMGYVFGEVFAFSKKLTYIVLVT